MFSLALAGRDLALGHNPARVCSKTHTHECGAREKGAAKQTSMRACTRLGRARLQEASEVKRRRARLVPGWGTAHGRYWRSRAPRARAKQYVEHLLRPTRHRAVLKAKSWQHPEVFPGGPHPGGSLGATFENRKRPALRRARTAANGWNLCTAETPRLPRHIRHHKSTWQGHMV